MTNDDLIYRHRLQLFARAAQVGVSRACEELGYHRSWYYRWKPMVERHGLEILRPRERRKPRMPNQMPPWLEERVVSFALGHPGLGPRRVAAQLALPMWGGLVVSASGVLKVLRRHGLGTRLKRLSLIAGYAALPQPEGPPALEPMHLEADAPGDLVQFDCFHIGRLSGTTGRVWQYTAIDVASSYVWAEVHVTPLRPLSQVHLRASSPGGWGGDGGRMAVQRGQHRERSEFRSEFRQAVASGEANQRFIRDGRPQTNGCVEQVQRTVLEECWRPTFARSLVPKYTALKRDLEQYLNYYNFERAHTGRRNPGRTPAELVYGARKMFRR